MDYLKLLFKSKQILKNQIYNFFRKQECLENRKIKIIISKEVSLWNELAISFSNESEKILSKRTMICDAKIITKNKNVYIQPKLSTNDINLLALGYSNVLKNSVDQNIKPLTI